MKKQHAVVILSIVTLGLSSVAYAQSPLTDGHVFIGGGSAFVSDVRLVKAFRKALKELERLRKQANEPDWKLIRDETKIGFKWMNETLQEKRAAIGKKTEWMHYSNEARLINAVLTNRFSGLDRNTLSASDLQLMADLQRYNAILIGQDMPYQKRKAVLMDRATQKLTAHVTPALDSGVTNNTTQQ